MDHVQLVGSGHRLGDLEPDAHRPLDGKRTASDRLVQRRPIQELHHQVDETVVRLTEVGDVDDVLVVDAVGRPRLPEEAGAVGRLVGEVRGEEFDRHVATDDLVPGAVDHAHPARADAFGDDEPAGDRSAQQRVRKVHERSPIEGTGLWIPPKARPADLADPQSSSPAILSSSAGLRQRPREGGSPRALLTFPMHDHTTPS